MRVLGIDPGTRVCGWGVVEAGPRRTVHLAHGVVRLGDAPLSERLGRLFEALEEIIATHGPQEVAVEGVFTARNVRSALTLGHARGVALLCAGRAGLTVAEYAPATVKKALAGTGQAEKHQIQRMVGTVLGIADPAVADAADALAVALCHLQHAGAAAGVGSVVRHRQATTPAAAALPVRSAPGAARRAEAAALARMLARAEAAEDPTAPPGDRRRTRNRT